MKLIQKTQNCPIMQNFHNIQSFGGHIYDSYPIAISLL